MNKRNLFMLLAVMSLCAAVMSGCSDENEERMPQMTTAAVNNYKAKDSDTVVTGEVTEIAGNRVTLALGTLNENNSGGFGRDENSERDFPQMSEGERPNFEEGSFRENNYGGRRPDFSSGEMPDFGDREMPFGGFNRDFSDRDSSDFDSENFGFNRGSFGENGDFGSGAGGDRMMGGSRRGGASIEKNGGEGTYIIPVGMPIEGLSGRNADYSGITVGTILTLTINEDGVVCAAGVE